MSSFFPPRWQAKLLSALPYQRSLGWIDKGNCHLFIQLPAGFWHKSWAWAQQRQDRFDFSPGYHVRNVHSNGPVFWTLLTWSIGFMQVTSCSTHSLNVSHLYMILCLCFVIVTSKNMNMDITLIVSSILKVLEIHMDTAASFTVIHLVCICLSPTLCVFHGRKMFVGLCFITAHSWFELFYVGHQCLSWSSAVIFVAKCEMFTSTMSASLQPQTWKWLWWTLAWCFVMIDDIQRQLQSLVQFVETLPKIPSSTEFSMIEFEFILAAMISSFIEGLIFTCVDH